MIIGILLSCMALFVAHQAGWVSLRTTTAESINWHPVSVPPDADLAVLIFPGIDGEVSEGFLDGDTWRDAMAWPRTPTHWAPMPEGPKA